MNGTSSPDSVKSVGGLKQNVVSEGPILISTTEVVGEFVMGQLRYDSDPRSYSFRTISLFFIETRFLVPSRRGIWQTKRAPGC